MVKWGYFSRPEFKAVNNKYLPFRGEGDTIATQIVTAVNKLIYKWYNDGDVYDNSHYMTGWVNNISSFANWLYEHTSASDILESIWECQTGDEYEDILVKLANLLLNEKYLENVAKEPKDGSVYHCSGPFTFKLYN